MPGGEGVNALFCREPELGRRSEDRVGDVLQPPKHAAHRRGTEEYPIEDEKKAHMNPTMSPRENAINDQISRSSPMGTEAAR
jgi:hypothetical protein